MILELTGGAVDVRHIWSIWKDDWKVSEAGKISRFSIELRSMSDAYSEMTYSGEEERDKDYDKLLTAWKDYNNGN